MRGERRERAGPGRGLLGAWSLSKPMARCEASQAARRGRSGRLGERERAECGSERVAAWRGMERVGERGSARRCAARTRARHAQAMPRLCSGCAQAGAAEYLLPNGGGARTAGRSSALADRVAAPRQPGLEHAAVSPPGSARLRQGGGAGLGRAARGWTKRGEGDEQLSGAGQCSPQPIEADAHRMLSPRALCCAHRLLQGVRSLRKIAEYRDVPRVCSVWIGDPSAVTSAVPDECPERRSARNM